MTDLHPVALARQFDDAYRRIRVLETHSLGIPFNPATKKATVLVDLSIPALAAAYPNAPTPTIYTLQSGIFTVVGAGATYVLEGSIDARMLQWDNTIAAPRREGWLDVQGLAATGHIEWPFGITEVTNVWRTADTAIAAGTYTARALFQQAGFNDVQIFGGYLRLTITQ